jgi:Holliday junction resolvasome RuvABC endonuclease subunit
MNNLVNTLHSQDKLEEAAAMRKEVLEKIQRILGKEHPDTIRAMINLAIAICAQENAHGSNHTNPYTTTPKG